MIPANRREEIKQAKQQLKAGKPIEIYTGILPTETPLRPDTRIYHGNFYVINEMINGIEGRVIAAQVSGTIDKLKKSLEKAGYIFTRIHWCDLKSRNLLNKRNHDSKN